MPSEPHPLSPTELATELADLAEWKHEGNQLVCDLEFRDFVQAFGFMTQVALLAEKAWHHPTWSNTFNTVQIRLSTHEAGDVVTKLDTDLARAIERVIGSHVRELSR